MKQMKMTLAGVLAMLCAVCATALAGCAGRQSTREAAQAALAGEDAALAVLCTRQDAGAALLELYAESQKAEKPDTALQERIAGLLKRTDISATVTSAEIAAVALQDAGCANALLASGFEEMYSLVYDSVPLLRTLAERADAGRALCSWYAENGASTETAASLGARVYVQAALERPEYTAQLTTEERASVPSLLDR